MVPVAGVKSLSDLPPKDRLPRTNSRTGSKTGGKNLNTPRLEQINEDSDLSPSRDNSQKRTQKQTSPDTERKRSRGRSRKSSRSSKRRSKWYLKLMTRPLPNSTSYNILLDKIMHNTRNRQVRGFVPVDVGKEYLSCLPNFQRISELNDPWSAFASTVIRGIVEVPIEIRNTTEGPIN